MGWCRNGIYQFPLFCCHSQVGRVRRSPWELNKGTLVWHSGRGAGSQRQAITYAYSYRPVHPKGNQSWIFTGRTDAEAETPILWPPDAKNGLTGKDSDAGKDWRQEEKGTTEDEMVGWHLWLNGRVWVNSRSWWWTGRPGVLQSMGLQRVGHDWATELLLLLSHFSRVQLWDPIDGSPRGSPVPGILQARTLEWGAIFFSNAWKWKEKVKSFSRVRLLATQESP